MKVEVGSSIPGFDVVESLGLVEGFAFRGIGFWTSVCVGFANFFGTHSNHYRDKMIDLIDEAQVDMVDDALKVKADAIINYSAKISGLSVYVCGTAVTLKKTEE